MILEWHYIRRCRECWYTARFDLPSLTKKIVYVDQFGISNMMKAINPETKAHEAGRVDERWLILFRRLDRLSKLQLIICPYSDFHRYESAVSAYNSDLRRMYELLSGGATFQDAYFIVQSQIHQHAGRWIAGRATEPFELHAEEVIHGRLHGWQERFLITVNVDTADNLIGELRQQRERIQTELAVIFEQWRTEPKSFQEDFDEEVKGYGEALVELYFGYFDRVKETLARREFPTIDVMLPPPAVDTIDIIRDVFREAGVSDAEIRQKVAEYLLSGALKDVPLVKITAMLYAALARKARAGQKRPPNQGFASDIRMVAALLPYCNGMFVDNEIAGYLREEPLASEICRDKQVFSPNTMDEFIEYLEHLETSASPEHLERVREVYGPEWGKPYETMYISGKKKDE